MVRMRCIRVLLSALWNYGKDFLIGPEIRCSIRPVFCGWRARTIPEFLEKIRTGACFVWGVEMGFRMLLSDVYRMVFKYYGSVLDWKNPEFSGAEKARHLALAAVGAPFSAAGVPLAVTTLNYLKQIFVTKTVGQELLEHWEGDREPS